jgi:hypothetical protein
VWEELPGNRRYTARQNARLELGWGQVEGRLLTQLEMGDGEPENIELQLCANQTNRKRSCKIFSDNF